MSVETPQWNYRKAEEIEPSSLQITVIADYGGDQHNPDSAFREVHNHFRRHDERNLIREITDCPVQAFSTLETGFWLGQLALHSEYEDLILFSNTAPRGDIAWHGQREQPFVCGLLDNGIPFFAVNSGYNLSFVKDRIVGMWEVGVSNMGTQFRSRDQYPEAAMKILNGDLSMLGQVLDPEDIPNVPQNRIASIDGYRNLKTTIRKSEITDELLEFPILRVTINGVSNFVVNTLIDGVEGKRRSRVGDLCMVVGSSGGKKDNFVEFIRYYGPAAEDWCLSGALIDDLDEILIEPPREILLYQRQSSVVT